jgi:hypothetical protein
MSETKTKNLCTVPAADLTDSQYFIAEDGGELKRIPKAQVVLKKLENMLATDTENLAGGGEVTAQELLDALAEQVANKLLAKSQVVNNLLATVEGNPLDATQGKALKDLIDTTNNNLSKCLQYIHSETDVFDFNDPKTPAGYHRLGAAASYKNAPSGLDGVNFCTVEVVRPTISDTLAMTIYPYKKGINPPVWYKSGGSNEWPTLPWNVYATKSDLSNMTKKDSSKFMPGDTVLDVSAWSAITLLSIVTYKDEATALYLIRKESSNKIYCIPVKSSTQVSVTHNGENKLTLSNSATYGGTWAVLFLS